MRRTLLCLLLACAAAALAAAVPDAATEAAFQPPPGYVFHDFVSFTDAPNAGRPHLRLHEPSAEAAAAAAAAAEAGEGEGWHTLLVTPDGRAYKKPLANSLAELAAAGLPAGLLQPHPVNQEQQPQQQQQQQASRRQLRQFVIPVTPPNASIGVSTSGDLSCNGCGPDNRAQVADTTAYPFQTVGRLVGQLGTSSTALECSGTLIGRKHVLTAAHCVFDINASRKMVASLNFQPALDASYAPYGTLPWTQARIVTRFSSQPGYTTTAMNYDFALITLAREATSGYLGLFFPPGAAVTQTASLTTAGYPGSKPSGTMWSAACGNVSIDYSSNNAFANVAQCANGACSNILTHTCISSDGQSGSGIWDTDFKIRAILTGKVTTSAGDAYNVGTEIDTETYNQIAAWYNEDGDPAGNGTLPLAPSGPGSRPAAQNAFTRWWNEHWPKPWFIAVVVFVGLTVLAVVFLATLSCCRGCGCCERKRSPPKAAVALPGVPVTAAAGPRSGLPPRPPQPLRPEGVTYNPGSGQFMLNGQQYGQYTGGNYPSYATEGRGQHGRTPSTVPLFR